MLSGRDFLGAAFGAAGLDRGPGNLTRLDGLEAVTHVWASDAPPASSTFRAPSAPAAATALPWHE